MFESLPEILDPDSSYIAVIVMLLPLSAGLLVSQTNPFHALIIRGILGAVAALVYAVLGAADVALTEALVGTMLSTTLYAVAVRSSMQTAAELSNTKVSGPYPLENSRNPQLDDGGISKT